MHTSTSEAPQPAGHHAHGRDICTLTTCVNAAPPHHCYRSRSAAHPDLPAPPRPAAWAGLGAASTSSIEGQDRAAASQRLGVPLLCLAAALPRGFARGRRGSAPRRCASLCARARLPDLVCIWDPGLYGLPAGMGGWLGSVCLRVAAPGAGEQPAPLPKSTGMGSPRVGRQRAGELCFSLSAADKNTAISWLCSSEHPRTAGTGQEEGRKAAACCPLPKGAHVLLRHLVFLCQRQLKAQQGPASQELTALKTENGEKEICLPQCPGSTRCPKAILCPGVTAPAWAQIREGRDDGTPMAPRWHPSLGAAGSPPRCTRSLPTPPQFTPTGREGGFCLVEEQRGH